MPALETENFKLRDQLKRLLAEATKNETILKRAQQRELALLNAGSLEELLGRLVDGLADSFGLDEVTLVLRDPEHEVRHLLMGAGTQPADLPGVLFVDGLQGLSPAYASLRKPWLGPYQAADHQLLFGGRAKPGSVAILPLRRQEHLIGSLNLASGDRQRFTRDHATDFLAHLAVIAAFCLENAVNRARLVRSGYTDMLTGWHNRRYLQYRLVEELARAQRGRRPLACLMLDVDHFKRVNDAHGHLVGDSVLREIAARVEGEVRAGDVAARFGGEEFALLLPDTGIDAAVAMAERIRRAVSAAPVSAGAAGALTVTVSLGINVLVPPPDRVDLRPVGEELIAGADAALYRAKGAGRDRVVVFGRG